MKMPLLVLLAVILPGSCSGDSDSMSVSTDENSTTILFGDQPLLRYVHEETLPPDGVDPLYKRSAYIHPLWSPGGEVLTRISPPDHYHHYGIWNPWTRTNFSGRKVDFWNLGDGQGTVRFAEYLGKSQTDEYAGFKVRQDHIYFLEDGTEEVAINETWDVKVLEAGNESYMVDLTTTLNCPMDGGIELEAYRYGGGLGFRATEKWHKDNCTVLTSEGLSRPEADGTGARWCIVEGESSVPEGRSGILFLSHPSNQAHPEPMRIWPEDSNGGRGDMFFEFCPIRHKEWRLEQGVDYVLKYRMVVFDGVMDPETAEIHWQTFSTYVPK